MIYTLGCSFTKWRWHTWSDWLAEYTNEPVVNLAWPGLSNEVIYWELLNRVNTIDSLDTVYIMLTGNNRVSQWYDREWIDKKDCQGFFPDQLGQLEFGVDPWRGMYRLHPDYDVSLTHMIIDNFKIIYQIQNLLDSIGCNYRFVFWQNPWYDTRPKHKPIWQAIWPSKQGLDKQEIATAESILKINAVKNLITGIDWSKFFLPPGNMLDPTTYQGMWEFKNQLQLKDPAYLKYAHVDPHPDTVIQHDFLTDVVLNCPHRSSIRQRAIDFAIRSQEYKEVVVERPNLIVKSLDTALQKLYTSNKLEI